MLAAALTTPRPLFVICLASSLIAITGCGKEERPMTTEERLKAVQTKQETQPDFFVQRNSVDYMTDLRAIRDNTARAEAAPKVDAALVSPNAAAQLARAEAQRTTAAAAAAAAPATPSPLAAAPGPSPAQTTAPATAPATAQPAAAAAPAPITQATTPAPRATADVSAVAISRTQPDFPRDAIRQGVESGNVRARMIINGAGDVTSVNIISARPARVFDREVQFALQRWKFNPGADGRSFDTEINFQR